MNHSIILFIWYLYLGEVLVVASLFKVKAYYLGNHGNKEDSIHHLVYLEQIFICHSPYSELCVYSHLSHLTPHDMPSHPSRCL